MGAALIGILSEGAALGGLVLALQSRTDGFERRFGEELAGKRAELRALGERVARLESSGVFRPAQPSEVAGG